MFKETIVYTILTSIVLFVAYIFNILLEMCLFILYYYFIKGLFNKQFHADTITRTAKSAVRLCFLITFLTQLVFVFILISFKLSYYLNIYIGILLGVFSYIFEDWLEKVIAQRKLLRNEYALIQACKNAHISHNSMNRMILRYIKGYKIRDIARLESVEESTIWQSIRRSRRKLNLNDDE